MVCRLQTETGEQRQPWGRPREPSGHLVHPRTHPRNSEWVVSENPPPVEQTHATCPNAEPSQTNWRSSSQAHSGGPPLSSRQHQLDDVLLKKPWGVPSHFAGCPLPPAWHGLLGFLVCHGFQPFCSWLRCPAVWAWPRPPACPEVVAMIEVIVHRPLPGPRTSPPVSVLGKRCRLLPIPHPELPSASTRFIFSPLTIQFYRCGNWDPGPLGCAERQFQAEIPVEAHSEQQRGNGGKGKPERKKNQTAARQASAAAWRASQCISTNLTCEAAMSGMQEIWLSVNVKGIKSANTALAWREHKFKCSG